MNADFHHNLVLGCPLCEIFLNPERNITTRLYYPSSLSTIEECDFVILDCKTCNIPMMVVKDHTTRVSKQNWGKMLYITRQLFGQNIQTRCKPRKIFDHFHCHIIR